MKEKDTLHRFLFEDCSVRGEWVHLDASWQTLSANADYPEPVKNALGEAVAAVALLAATIKFDGSLTLQINGSGYIGMLVVQVTGEKTLRGLAHWDEDADVIPERMFADDTRLVMTLDPGEGKERYQGMVMLEGDSVASALEDYFERSEQLSTRLWLTSNKESAAGLLLQRLPESAGDQDEEDWSRLNIITDTVTNKELLSLPVEDLLHRLYHEETLRLFDREVLSFRCRCSRDKVAAVIVSMGKEDSRDLLEEEGEISVQCEFCNKTYEFDPVDVEGLFRGASSVDVSTRSQ
ncbi:MAG: Hsp33 family molecular chaperone HslO [bacterium]